MMKNKELIILEDINADNLVNVSQWKKKQNQIVKQNPFVKIEDNKTYILAKQHRTNLLKGRTSLLGTNGQENIIRKSFKTLLNGSIEILKSLANITEPHYEEQQNEIKRYESILEEKRKEKLRKIEEERLAEEKRKEEIVAKINDVYATAKELIDGTNFNGIKNTESYIKGLKENDGSEYEEFKISYLQTIETLELDFDKKKILLKEDEKRRIDKIKLDKEREEFEKQKRISREIEREKQKKIDELNRKKEDELKKKEEEIRLEKQRLLDLENERLRKEKEELRIKQEKLKLKSERKRKLELKPDIEKAVKIIESTNPTIKVDVKKEEVKNVLNRFLSEIDSLKDKYILNINSI